MSYKCKWCDYQASDEAPESDNQELFNILNTHQREEHSEERRSIGGRHKTGSQPRPKKIRSQTVEKGGDSAGSVQRDGDVRVRLTNEQISLPGELFVLYTWIKTQYPEYEASKSEWLQHVVATWAIEHAEEIKLPAIPGVFVGNALNLDGLEDDDDEQTEQEQYAVADWNTGE